VNEDLVLALAVIGTLLALAGVTMLSAYLRRLRPPPDLLTLHGRA
jgi:hypothetical protein